MLPTVCYVAGPNELAYLGQLRSVYERFGVPMPLMYSRATATILDSAAIDKVQHEAWPEATNADELHDALMLLAVMACDEVQRTVHHEANGAGPERLR